jgi:hypothetical protein
MAGRVSVWRSPRRSHKQLSRGIESAHSVKFAGCFPRGVCAYLGGRRESRIKIRRQLPELASNLTGLDGGLVPLMQIAVAERCRRHTASFEADGQPCDMIGGFPAKVTIPWRLPSASPPSMTIMLDRHRAGWRFSARMVPVPSAEVRNRLAMRPLNRSFCRYQAIRNVEHPVSLNNAK